MAEKTLDMSIGLGMEYDPGGAAAANADIEKLKTAAASVPSPGTAPAAAPQGGGEAVAEATQAQQQLAEATQAATTATVEQAAAMEPTNEQLTREAATLWELAEAKSGHVQADAREQKAMQLATKSRNELIKILKRLQKELKAAAEAQDVEKYRAVKQEIAETRSAFEKQNQVLELNNIQLGQHAQNGLMVANTLSGMANGLKDGSISAADFAGGIMAISAAMKAGLGPIGWVMLALQGLQAAWDYFSAEDEKKEEVRKKRAADMQQLAEITENARKALVKYNSTELSKKSLAAVQGYYAEINRELEQQIKNIDRATQAELARLALTQDAEEHRRTMQRAKLGRQLAAGTISQEEYDQKIFDMNEAATLQGLDAEVGAAEREEKDLTGKVNAAWDAYHETQAKHLPIAGLRESYGKLTVERLELLKGVFDALTDAQAKAIEERDALIDEDADEEQIAAAHDKLNAIMDKRADAAEKIWQAYDQVHGKGAHQSRESGTTEEMIAGMIAGRRDVDEQYTSSKAERDRLRAVVDGLLAEQHAARENVKNARDRRTQEQGQAAERRQDFQQGQALDKLLAEKNAAAAELAGLEMAELKRRRKDAQNRAKAARKTGDAEGAKVLDDLAILYKEEQTRRNRADKAEAAVGAAREKLDAQPAATDKRTEAVLREAEQLANRMAKGEALDGRSAEQLLALWKQAQATRDKKDDAFVAQLINLMQVQADVGATLQAELRTLKRKTEKLSNRNLD